MNVTNEKITQSGPMAWAALIFGVVSVPFGFVFIGTLFSGLGITFALLSRGNGRMTQKAVIGLVCSIAGLVTFWIGFLLLAVIFAYLGLALPVETLADGSLPFLIAVIRALLA